VSGEQAGVGVSSARPPQPWYLHRTVLFLGTLTVLWAIWAGYSSVTARQKLDPPLLRALEAHQVVNIWVEFPFPPEEFHIRYMQDRGTVTGVRGRWIHLMRVRPAVAWSIARLYWVQRVQGEPGPQGAIVDRARFSQRRMDHAILPV
jgi:hypothetical protein